MLNLSITNQGKEKEIIINIISCVTSHTEKLGISKKINSNDVGLYHFESKSITCKDNIVLKDLSWASIYNEEKEGKLFSFSGKSFSSTSEDILLTRVISQDKLGNELPLFYKHNKKLKEGKIQRIVYGKELEEIFGYEFVNGYIYTNYENQYDIESGSYKLYFINGIDFNGNQVNELLNPVKAFEKATWENLDLESGEIVGDVYVLEEKNIGFDVKVFFDEKEICGTNQENKLYAKTGKNSLIRLIKPEEDSNQNSWILKVSNGAFWDNKKYWVSEFINQNFNPELGILKKENKDCLLVNKNILKLPEKEIIINEDKNCELNLYIYDSLYKIKKVISTNKNMIGERYNENLIWESGIESFDLKNGFVELDKSLELNDIVKANFFYNTKDYSLVEIDINPFKNKKIVDKNLLVYLKPNMLRGERSIEWLFFDDKGRVCEASQKELKVKVNNSFNQNTIISESIDTFFEMYCYGNENNFQYLPLGEISYKEDFYIEEIEVIDIRNKENLELEEAIKRQWKLLQSKYGYGKDGQVVQKNNIIYVKVPLEILEKESEEVIEKAIRRKLPAHVEVVIDYVYEKSNLTILNNIENQINISMSWEMPGSYKLYKSNKEDGVKELIYQKESTSIETISYTDNNVVSGKTYYYWARINDYPLGDTYGVEVR
jgi:hypothetical protein